MFTYPPSLGTLSGDVYTASIFLKSPANVMRRLHQITEQRFIATSLLSGRVEGTGSVIYGVSEGLYSERGPEQVAPGAEYPKTGAGKPVVAQTPIPKWGLAGPVVDEAIKRTTLNAVDRTLIKIGNRMIQNVDSVFLTAIGAAVTQSVAATAAWSTVSTKLLDVNKAKAAITGQNQGYVADTLILTDTLLAQLVSDKDVLAGLTRESVSAPTGTGEIVRLAGLKLMATPNLPAGVSALVLDSSALGSMAYEDIGGPGWTGSITDAVQSKTVRMETADSWLIMTRKPVAPMVQEPAAACIITGV